MQEFYYFYENRNKKDDKKYKKVCLPHIVGLTASPVLDIDNITVKNHNIIETKI